MVLVDENIVHHIREGSRRIYTCKDAINGYNKLYTTKLYIYSQCQDNNYKMIPDDNENEDEYPDQSYHDKSSNYGYAYVLWESYCKLMMLRRFDIITEILTVNNGCGNGNGDVDITCDDFIAICLAAIRTNCINVIDILLNIGFDINCMLISKFIPTDTWINAKPYKNNPKYANSGYTTNINAFSYAIEFGTLNMVKHLVQNGCDPKITNDGVLKSCKNIDTFRYVLSIIDIDNYMIDLLNCFIVCNNNDQDNDQNFFGIPGSCDTNTKVEKIKIILDYCNQSKLSSYINDQFGDCHVDAIQLLEQNNIMLNWDKLLYAACRCNNTKLIEYILGKNIQPNSETIDHVFNDVKKKTIRLFIKHKVNLSALKMCSKNNDNSDNFFNQFEECGLDKDVFISYLMNESRPNSWQQSEYNPNFSWSENAGHAFELV